MRIKQQLCCVRKTTMTHSFKRFFSVDSAKAVKAQEYGWLNAINYMAPHSTGGVGNLCPMASAGCMALCLGTESGQAAMVSKATGTNAVRESRKRKAQYFMGSRKAFMNEAALHVAQQLVSASKLGFRLCVRMNGATDVAWEGIGFQLDFETADQINKALKPLGHSVSAGIVRSIYHLFPFVQFVDYTKIHGRFSKPLPANLHLTFSRAENNEAKTLELLARGVNVAVVFAGTIPATWNGFPVVNGDEHDLRHLDPKGGYVIGLTPKGNKAKRDQSGFVVRDALAIAA
jgi:hypothetical protein